MIELTEKEIDIYILKAIADGEDGFVYWYNLDEKRLEGYNVGDSTRYSIHKMLSDSSRVYAWKGEHHTCLKNLTP